MYGGRGILPRRSSTSRKIPLQMELHELVTVFPSPTTVAVSSPPPKDSSVPVWVFRPGFVRHSQTPLP